MMSLWLVAAMLGMIMPIEISAVFTCSPHETAAFVRVSRARLTGTPVVVTSGGDDLNCAQYCKNNVEPTTGAQRACASFNFDGRETCYFFDNAATPAGSGVLAPNPSANNFYYEKMCLPGHFTGSGSVPREECLAACLKEENFVCRSVNYNYNNYFCELSSEDRRTKPNYMRLTTSEPVDYFDNNCLTRQNRCGQLGGNLVFVKTSTFEIHHYDHTSTVESQQSSCLQKCLDSLNTFCRSVEFAPDQSKCIISDEDTFSRADQQGKPDNYLRKDYYEPVCVAADLTSSTCRQQAAFERYIGQSIDGQPIASAKGVTVADCISLCFQNLDCKSMNYDRTSLTCYIYKVGKSEGYLKQNPSNDFYEFNCESQFGGMAMCTNEGIRFIVNTKQPYTGAIYAAERFSTCSQVVSNAKQIQMTFPPPTTSTDCGTTLKDGKLEALVVISLDGVMPHQVTTEWDRFYRIICDTTMPGMDSTGTMEGTVMVTTIYDAGEAAAKMLPSATPAPVVVNLMFLSPDTTQRLGVPQEDTVVQQTSIGDKVLLAVKSEQAGPNNLMLVDCTAMRVGGSGDSVPFKVIEQGCPRYPALVGPVHRDFEKRRLTAEMRAFRLDGSFDIEMMCSVMVCAAPAGCPPSNCMDSGNGEVFQSYGRKKRAIHPTISTGNNMIEETITAVIRVLADGESAADGDGFYHRNDSLPVAPPTGSMDPLSANDTEMSNMSVCLNTGTFIGIVAGASALCIVFSLAIIAVICRGTDDSVDKRKGW